MLIHLESARRKLDKLVEQYGDDAVILNVTSKGPDPWVKFSPFYPHGDIPIPFSPGPTAASVEGVWQGLKVFDGADVCEATLADTTLKNIKRTVRRYGIVMGHRRGVKGDEVLGYKPPHRENSRRKV
jgi:hypothetical protein